MAEVTLRSIAGFAVGGALLCGCAAQSLVIPSGAVPQAKGSILVSSDPAAGSTGRAPFKALRLHFNPPARLDELSVSGPDGVMPTMVHAVGEVSDYSIPLSDLGPGAYTVSWRASSQGREYRGSFGFTLR
jgi:methionine-rich copper-binding protein CopC